jgi:polyhydroxyalkanoate synthesis regulator phasin
VGRHGESTLASAPEKKHPRTSSSTLSTPVTDPRRDDAEAQGGGTSEALRSAIEKTFAATAGSAAETRERAGELLDDVARRGQEAREEVSRRGQEAREEVARRGHEAREEVARRGQGVTDRVSSLIGRIRPETADLQREVDRLRDRVSTLERELKSKSKLKG